MPQDSSATTAYLLVKDANEVVVGRVFHPLALRQLTISIDDKEFLIKFPLTWKRTAILYSSNSEEIIARYNGQQEYEINGYGIIKSKRQFLSMNRIVNYQLDKKIIGTSQEISSTFSRGRIALLPLDLPLEIRIFMLSV